MVAILVIAAWAAQSYLPSVAREQFQSSELSRLLGKSTDTQEQLEGWSDIDGDLLPDAPADADCVSPGKIVFSYVASRDDETPEDSWRPFLDSLTEATQREIEYQHYSSVDEQVEALAGGQLHVTAMNTGAVPMAVNRAGFIPVSTFGTENSFGYTMNLLVKADSPIKKVQDLRDKKITFVRPNSNSGFKAALAYLMDEHNMLPERDYQYGFSMGHDTSVTEVISGQTDAAPVASDLFDRMVRDGKVKADEVRVVYQSEVFPPVALGYVYNLDPSLRSAIAEQLIEFDWSDTPLQQTYSSPTVDRFVPVDYKVDWANIRRIDDAIEKARGRN